MTNKMTTNKQAKKLAKPVKAWAVADADGNMSIYIREIFDTRKRTKNCIDTLGLSGLRIARVEIREVEK